jgi:hypothetical protein
LKNKFEIDNKTNFRARHHRHLNTCFVDICGVNKIQKSKQKTFGKKISEFVIILK